MSEFLDSERDRAKFKSRKEKKNHQQLKEKRINKKKMK